jgi:redox-sensitive bicupin YhaK (pirin superfamily)
MARERTVHGVFKGDPFHWVGDGFRVSNYFPSGNDLAGRMSPFLLMDYHPRYDYTPTEKPRGVGPHPHRGFETVTLAFEGSVAHHDSTGGGGVIGPGDAQWMTAASGILHKEYHEKSYARRGGPMHMMQLWVNLPKANKMDAPGYQALTAEQMGHVDLPDRGGFVRVIAGEYRGVGGPARTFTPINLWDVHLNAGAKLEASFPARQNLAVLVMDGDVAVNGAKAAARDLVVLENEGEILGVTAQTEAHLLLLNGEPIDEPVVFYGPFVMNTPQEIHQAIEDFNGGKFGFLR